MRPSHLRGAREKDREAGGGGRRIGLAVFLGAGLGLVAAVWHLQGSSSKPSSSSSRASLEEVEEAKGKLLELISEAERKKRDLGAQLQALQRQRQKTVAQGAGSEGRELEEILGYSLKVGRLGTLEGPRSSPLLVPDPSANPRLAELLEKVAVNKELIVGISNINIRDMLESWFASIKRLGITNFMVVALDDATRILCENNGVPVYRKEAKIAAAQQGTGDNHAISSSKFHLIRDFLVLGYSVFLSDIDVVYFQNPFEGDHLRRDVDVEGMTDGFTNDTAYVWDNLWDDTDFGSLRYTHTMRLFVFNSGLFYLRPTKACVELLDRVAARLAREKAWDQAVYNEEMFFPSRPGRRGLHISTRVLDYYKFLNSKTLFKEVRKDPKFDDFMPVTLHVNYHPDKHRRMVAAYDYYVNGNKEALKRFPDGSG